MRMDADGNEEISGDDHEYPQDEAWEPNDDRAFWRRRFLILCGGVVALGVCAWLFPGAHQPSTRSAAANRAAMAALTKREALPPAAYGSAWPAPRASDSPTASSSPTVSSSPSASPERSKTPNAKASSAHHPGPVPSASAGAPGACAPADIVLSLFTGQASYPRGARPQFSVYAVSTSSKPCTLRYGAGTVQVIVTRHGRVVWDSTACGSSAAPPVRFTLGVPHVLTMAWNPKATRPEGCAGSLPAGTGGTLDAVAMSDGQSSPVRSFTMGN